MFIVPDPLMPGLVLAIEADTTLFPAGGLLHLSTTNIAPTKNNVLADFTELTNVQVPGYLPAAQPWDGTPYRNVNGSWSDSGADVAFVASGPPPLPIVVYCWFMTDAGGTVLTGSGSLAQPFTFTRAGDGMSLESLLNLVQSAGNQLTLTLDQVQS
jgi:hypothetical protein